MHLRPYSQNLLGVLCSCEETEVQARALVYIDCKCCLNGCNCFIPAGRGEERGSGLETFAVYEGKSTVQVPMSWGMGW